MLRQNDAGWSNPKVLVILAVVFFCGLACGAALTSAFMHSRMNNGSNNQSMERARQVGWQKLRDELQLTPDQVRIVTKELDDYAKYYQNIEDQREDVAQLGTQHILAVLTPGQKERFYKLLGVRPLAGANAVPASTTSQ
jgi:uncharacterized membrane protein YciS (DUF1049 family)